MSDRHAVGKMDDSLFSMQCYDRGTCQHDMLCMRPELAACTAPAAVSVQAAWTIQQWAVMPQLQLHAGREFALPTQTPEPQVLHLVRR